MRKSWIKMAMLPFGFLLAGEIYSQSMNSPYSIYGIGDIDRAAVNRTSGMGGAGLAIPSTSDLLINNNVASITGLERSFFVVQLNGAGRFSRYSGTPVTANNSNNRDMWIREASIHVKLNNSWASGLGLKPYSRVSYSLVGSRFIEGTQDSYGTLYEGHGGINEYYWSNAFSLGKKFSIGMKTSLLSGAINQDETLYGNTLATTIATKQQDYYSQFRVEGGALFKTALNKKWDWSIGARYIPQTRLSSERTLTVEENGTVILEDELIDRDRFTLPTTAGIGMALVKNKRYTFAADYTYENWAALKVNGTGWKYGDSHRWAAGFESVKRNNQWGKLAESRFFQLGAFYERSSLIVRNEAIDDMGVTMGYGKRFNNRLAYAISATAGVRGTKQNDLIKENYFQLTVSFSYRDFLFSKGRQYY